MGVVHLPDTKTNGQVRSISQAAIALRSSLPQKRELPLFFPSELDDRPSSGVPETLRALCVMAGLSGVTPHVLRHTFGRIAGELRFSELTTRALLGHGARGSTQIYVLINEALRLAVDKVLGQIADLLDGREMRLMRAAS